MTASPGDPADGVVGATTASAPSVAVARHRRHRQNGAGRGRNLPPIRLGADEHAELVAAAQRAGLTLSGYVASAALAAARGTVPPVDTPARAALVELQQARGQVRRFAVNVNQAVAELHSTGEVPVWLQQAVEGSARAVARVEAAAVAARRALS